MSEPEERLPRRPLVVEAGACAGAGRAGQAAIEGDEMSGWDVTEYANSICATCWVYVNRRADGTLHPHDRYAEGCGPGVQPGVGCGCRFASAHTMVPCEGGGPW